MLRPRSSLHWVSSVARPAHLALDWDGTPNCAMSFQWFCRNTLDLGRFNFTGFFYCLDVVWVNGTHTCSWIVFHFRRVEHLYYSMELWGCEPSQSNCWADLYCCSSSSLSMLAINCFSSWYCSRMKASELPLQYWLESWARVQWTEVALCCHQGQHCSFSSHWK